MSPTTTTDDVDIPNCKTVTRRYEERTTGTPDKVCLLCNKGYTVTLEGTCSRDGETGIYNDVTIGSVTKTIFNGGVTGCKAIEYYLTIASGAYDSGRVAYTWNKRCMKADPAWSAGSNTPVP